MNDAKSILLQNENFFIGFLKTSVKIDTSTASVLPRISLPSISIQNLKFKIHNL